MFKWLLTSDYYDMGRVRFVRDAQGKCQFVSWKSIDVVFFYTNTNLDMVILIESSAGTIMCNVPRGELDELTTERQKNKFGQWFQQRYLEQNAQLSAAIAEANAYLDQYQPEYSSESRSLLFIYGVQIWTTHPRSDPSRLHFPTAVEVVQTELISFLDQMGRYYLPAVYGFADGTPRGSSEVSTSPPYTCAIWQAPPIPYIGPEGQSLLRSTAEIFLGKSGAVPGRRATSQDGIAAVAKIDLSVGDIVKSYKIGETKIYDELAFFKGKLHECPTPSRFRSEVDRN